MVVGVKCVIKDYEYVPACARMSLCVRVHERLSVIRT